jgi:phage major head subunit gpT-like protein
MLGPAIADRAKYANAEIGFHVAFFEALEKLGEQELMALATEIPSTTAIEELHWIGDLPGFEEWIADRSMGGMVRKKITVANKDWANGVAIHRNEILDDKLGLALNKIQMLAGKAARHKSDLLVRVLLNGFDGANPKFGDGLAYDGKFLFSATHAFGSNLLNTALTESALDTAQQMLGDFTTDDGADPLEMSGTTLVVGKKNEATALRLTGLGILINQAGTAAGGNIYQGRFKVIVSPRIRGTFANYWFLADLSQPVKPVIFQNREPITTAAQVDWHCPDMFKRGQMNFGAQARYNVANYAPQTIVGSRGGS